MDAILGGLIVELTAAAAIRLATQISIGRTKRKTRKDDAILDVLTGSQRITEPLSVRSVSLPVGLTQQGLSDLLKTEAAQSFATELLVATIAQSPENHLTGLAAEWRDQCSYLLPTIAVPARNRLAAEIFTALLGACKTIASSIAELYPELSAKMRHDVHLKRMTFVLEAIERRLAEGKVAHHVSPAEQADYLRQYLQQVRSKHGHLEPPDFDRRKRVPLETLYVAPTIAGRNLIHNHIAIDDFRKRIDRTVLLGDPGGGKSTASTYVMFTSAANRGTSPVPFLVVLRDFAAGSTLDESIVEHIERRLRVFYQCTPPPGLVKDLLETGQAMVVFDGLDELLDTSRRREVTDVVELFSVRYPLARILVTSRKVGYDQAPMDPSQFRAYELAGFNVAQTEEYVRRWFSQDETLTADDAEIWTSSFMAESESVVDLRSNPLLLALMCIIYRGEKSIPRNRPAVYERCATMLFEKWDSSRKINIELRAGQLVDPAMKYLAYWMLTNTKTNEGVTESELVERAARYLENHNFDDPYEAQAAAREFVEFCRGRAWVFSDAGSTAEGEALYKFTHRTFMEYFAAYHLTRISDSPERLARTLKPRVANAEWDVVAQLAVQIMDKHKEAGAERIFRSFLDDKVRRSAPKRDNLLGFMCRCLSFVTLQPRTIRRLASAVVVSTTHLCTDRPQPGDRSSSLGWLLTNAADPREQVIRNELRREIQALSVSGDSVTARRGLTVAASGWLSLYMIDRLVRPSTDTWISFFGEVFEETYNALPDEELRNEPAVKSYALMRRLTSVSDHTSHGKDLAALYAPMDSNFFGIALPPIGHTLAYYLIHSSLSWIKDPQGLLAEIGVLVSRGDYSPRPVKLNSLAPFVRDNIPLGKADLLPPPAFPEPVLTGGAALMCIALEMEVGRSPVIEAARRGFALGHASFVLPYWKYRIGMDSLPSRTSIVPTVTHDFLIRWATGAVTFVETSSTSSSEGVARV